MIPPCTDQHQNFASSRESLPDQARPITAMSLSMCVGSSRCVLTFTSSDRSSGSVTRVGDAGEELLTQLFVALHFLHGPFDGRLSDVDARFEV